MSLVHSSSIAAVLAFALLAVPACSSPDTASVTSREITGKVDLNSYDLDNPSVVAESDDGRFFAASLEADGSFSLNVPSQQAYRLLLTNTTFTGNFSAISYIQWQTEVGYTAWAYCDNGGSIGVGTVKPPPGQTNCKSCGASKPTGGAGGSGGASGNAGNDAGCGVSVTVSGSGGGEDDDGKGSSGKGGGGSSDDSGGWGGSWGVHVEVSGCGDVDTSGGGSGKGGGKGGGGESGSGSGKGGGSVDYDAGASGSGSSSSGGKSGGSGAGKGGGCTSGSCPATPTPTKVCDDLGKSTTPPVSHCGSKAPNDVHGQSGKGGKGGKGGSTSSYDAEICTAPTPPAPTTPPVAKPGDACHVNAECGSAMFCCGSQCVSPSAHY